MNFVNIGASEDVLLFSHMDEVIAYFFSACVIIAKEKIEEEDPCCFEC